MEIRKEEVQLSLFSDGMTWYVEILKILQKSVITNNEFSEVSGY